MSGIAGNTVGGNSSITGFTAPSSPDVDKAAIGGNTGSSGVTGTSETYDEIFATFENTVQQLPEPGQTGLSHVNDAILRMSLLQDALNELMQNVSQTGVQSRLNQAEAENLKQIEQIKKQFDELQAAAEKSAEAQKKADMGTAMGDWIGVALTAIAIAVTVVAAVALGAVTGGAGAVALGVAVVAMVGALGAQTAMAVDSQQIYDEGVQREKEGGLYESGQSSINRDAASYTSMALGIVAAFASITSCVQVARAAGQAAKTAADVGTKAGKVAADASAQATKEAVKETAKKATSEATKVTSDLGRSQAVVSGVGQTVNQGAAAVNKTEAGKIQASAAGHEQKAETAEAAQKEIQAALKMLQTLIDNLQEECEGILNNGANILQIFSESVDKSEQSIKNIMATSPN
jgi:hypothetical protein